MCSLLSDKLRKETQMNPAIDIMIDTRQWVCVRWSIVGGHCYVGPFADADEAANWGAENQGTDGFWQVERLDPNVALEVPAPGEIPELEPNQEEPDQWTERQNDVGDFYLLMIDSDPLHLIGPFPAHRHAYSWAVAYEARTDDYGWQVLWLDNPAAPARLLTPAEGVEEAARSDAEWRRQCDWTATDPDSARL
jgi:hypothetical protein